MPHDFIELEADTMTLAESLCRLADSTDNNTIQNVEKCIYHLRTVAQNEYNTDFFRVFYKTFVNAMENIEVD